MKNNFNDVIQQLINVNELLLEGKIPVEFAKAIASNTQVIINAAKISLEYAKYTKSKDLFLDSEPIEVTLKKIEIESKKPFTLTK